IARRGRSVAKGRAALLRFRQKAGLIRVDSTVDWIAQQVRSERQVACSVEFVTTAADPIVDRLRDSGIAVATIYGGDRFDAEAERLRFQTGQATVCVFTTVASISLHAGETLADGRRASTEPRVGIFHQARFSGIAARQVTGRTHRDHQVSPWHIAYAEGTVEEQVGKVMVERIAAASDSVGSDTTGLVDLARLLGADWLPPTTMTDDGT
ncbi:MAG: helicase, partial [Aeromicrobium sp.]